MEQLAAPVGAKGPAGPPLRHRAVAQAEPVRHRRLARRLEPFLGLPPGPGPACPAQALLVLRIESLILAGALIMAAVLVARQPPPPEKRTGVRPQ
ncbi:hypothetical protein LP419_36035 [Massilia sp. H-1]|nr:hypothetical protein LP419_36035 [Massilia sp. H-1]